MKIVVNRQFGGASLSPLGVKHAVMNGVPLNHWNHDPNVEPKHTTGYKDLGDGWIQFGDGLFNDIVKDGQQFTSHLDSEIALRSHPGLIKTIEELGDKAFSRFSQLEIVDVPNDVDVQIEEYDGSEWIAEKHRTW